MIKNLISLKSKTALITGAAGRLGKIITMTLAELGANLILVDRPGSGMESFKKDIIGEFSIDVEVIECDLEIESERNTLITNLVSQNQIINILINNAAFVGSSNLDGWAVKFEKQSISTWRRAIEVNLTAPFHLCQGLSCLMSKNNNVGSIINIGSIYGKYSPDWSLYEGTEMGNPAAYAVSKAGIIQLTKWLSSTLAPNIRVNAISPGGIFRNQDKNFVNKYIKKTLLGRMAVEEDIAGAIAFLSSNLSSYVTGQVICVDGKGDTF